MMSSKYVHEGIEKIMNKDKTDQDGHWQKHRLSSLIACIGLLEFLIFLPFSVFAMIVCLFVWTTTTLGWI